jgi:hypothetical protein
MSVTVSDFAEVKKLGRADLWSLANREGIKEVPVKGLTDDGLRLLILQKRAGESLAQKAKRQRAAMMEAAPTCEERDCEEKVVEQEVCAWVSLPKYPEAPLGPLGDPKPAAYLSRCAAGHEVVRNVG